VVLTLSGSKTRGLMNYIAKSNGQPVSGLSMNIINEKPKQVMIGGQEFDSLKTYRIVTTDYLASGGDKMRFFSEPISYQPLNTKLRDAIMNYMRAENNKGNMLNPKTDGRIKSN
jgi:2',3'-cyclic-nucleotide 2'-phosphodiesterase (5'-nucleotidase family)